MLSAKAAAPLVPVLLPKSKNNMSELYPDNREGIQGVGPFTEEAASVSTEESVEVATVNEFEFPEREMDDN